ncbi:MAG: hypothetical protein PHY92_07045 [Alphaproteobacteria bacterium]|nr:hypothetical protein [Alphaproteobacteria bacterium]
MSDNSYFTKKYGPEIKSTKQIDALVGTDVPHEVYYKKGQASVHVPSAITWTQTHKLLKAFETTGGEVSVSLEGAETVISVKGEPALRKLGLVQLVR